jgi:hypothetical protein
VNNGRLLVSFHECRCATSDSAMLWKPPLGCDKVAASSVRNLVAGGCATAAAVDKPHYLGDGCVSRYRRAWRLRVALDKRYSGIIDRCRAAIDTLFPGQHSSISPRDDGW